MARAAKTIKTIKPETSSRKAARPGPVAAGKPKEAVASTAAKRAATTAASTRGQKQGRIKAPVAAPAARTKPMKATPRAPATPPAPKVSKEELRTQVEKLEQLVVTLRGKSRETNKAAKSAAAHILELEAQVAALEKQVAVAALPAARQPSEPAKIPRVKRQSRKSDAADPSALSDETSELATPEKDAGTASEGMPRFDDHDDDA